MGKKKKKTTTTVTTTVQTEIVKLTYLQTLAISQNLAQTSEFETDSVFNESVSSKKDDDFGFKEGLHAGPIGATLGAINDVFGFGTKVSTSDTSESTGAQIKDQWLQPEFDVLRYAIGIRELTASSYVFAPKSELVSIPYVSPKEIIKAHILVDQYIPPAFDQNVQWIEYFLKIEGEENWVKVNPLNSPTKFDANGDIIPKLINYNVPKPSTAQVESKYQTTADPVKGIRFKAVFTRPEGSEFQAMTPLLKSYRIIMSPAS